MDETLERIKRRYHQIGMTVERTYMEHYQDDVGYLLKIIEQLEPATPCKRCGKFICEHKSD